MSQSRSLEVASQTPWFFWIPEQYLAGPTLVARILRKVRRTYFAIFYPEYVRESIAANRTGECHRCGACCELVWRCPFLGRDAHDLPYCRVYGELRPTSCKNYPFDQIDSEIEQCGFKFN